MKILKLLLLLSQQLDILHYRAKCHIMYSTLVTQQFMDWPIYLFCHA